MAPSNFLKNFIITSSSAIDLVEKIYENDVADIYRILQTTENPMVSILWVDDRLIDVNPFILPFWTTEFGDEKVESSFISTKKSTMSAPEDRSEGVLVSTNPRTPAIVTAEQLKTMLTVIQEKILPLTRAGVANGSKMFGAAILDPDLKLLHADTNDETECALFHGEVKTIYAWSKGKNKTERCKLASTSIFLSTHEPCCMCISSILWSGFHTVYYLFPYEMTAQQGIPYDIETMHELWGVNTYRKNNKYLSSCCIFDLIEALEDPVEQKTLQEMATALVKEYDAVSQAQDVSSTVS